MPSRRARLRAGGEVEGRSRRAMGTCRRGVAARRRTGAGAACQRGKGGRCWPFPPLTYLPSPSLQASLRETALRLGLRTREVRKERAVGALKAARAAGRCSLPLHSRAQTHKHTHVAPGLIQADPEGHFSYETLEEIALSVQEALKGRVVPHCAFNGGRDVWVDVGNKALGIRALQVRGGKGPLAPHPRRGITPGAPFPPPLPSRRTLAQSRNARCTSGTGSRALGTTAWHGRWRTQCGSPTRGRRSAT